jgi:hypothetical protein
MGDDRKESSIGDGREMKLYVALRFSARPDLHCTLQYFGETDLAQLTTRIAKLMSEFKYQQFQIHATEEVIVGFSQPIRALKVPLINIPDWIGFFVQVKWLPHITCLENNLDLLVDSLAIMTHEEELVRWNLI